MVFTMKIVDALREIGRADLIGPSNLSPSIPFYEKKSNELCRYICAIKTSSRRISRTTKCVRETKVKDPETPRFAKNEIDTRADTTRCGKNFIPLVFTGQTRDVSGFHGDLETLPDIPVATCVTVFQHSSGKRFILIVHEALYFGDSLDHSLINPNQIRAFGIDVWDNPYDTERQFGIVTDEVFIPFETDGTTIYFDSFTPTMQDL